MTETMCDLDHEYRIVSGLNDRRYYEIFYSHLHPLPLLVLGQNPGGETDGTDLVESESFFENWDTTSPASAPIKIMRSQPPCAIFSRRFSPRDGSTLSDKYPQGLQAHRMPAP